MICTSFTQLTQGVSEPSKWALLYYAFYAHRCAVKVIIKSGKCLLLPFVNTDMDNRLAWSDGLSPIRLSYFYGSLENHYKKKKEIFGYSDREDPGFLQDSQKWWLNGHILCNVVPKNLWSTRGLDAMQEMIDEAIIVGDLKDNTYVLNKRDSPMMRTFGSPFSSLGATRLHPIYDRPMKPPLSFYVGPLWSDIAIPLPESWTWSTRDDADGGGFLLQKCFREFGILSQSEFESKLNTCVFRGTATGAGLNFDNQRIKLCSLRIEGLDAGITAWNQRDRIIDGVVHFQVPPQLPLCGRLTPKEQAQYKIILYVDGHQAASRLIWHLASGCAIFMVDPAPLCLAPKIWLHEYLIENVHFVRIAYDLSNLQSILQSFDSMRLFELAKNAYELANKILNRKALAKATAQALISSEMFPA